MKKVIITKGEKQTERLGESLAKSVLSRHKAIEKFPLIIALIGNLGGGKTTFIKGFARGLGIKERITSFL